MEEGRKRDQDQTLVQVRKKGDSLILMGKQEGGDR